MGARHVDDLFSLAYDGALDEVQQRRYQEHLASCPRCAAAAEEFRQAVGALRALPAARMPVRVVLPATPPVAEQRRGWLGGLAALRPSARAGWGMGAGLATAATLAVVLVAAHGHGGAGGAGVDSTTALAPNLAAGGGSSARKGAAGLADCPLPLFSTSGLGSSLTLDTLARPDGFANRVTVSNPQRPGEQLTLATTSSRYAPGAQVLVYAALTTPAGSGTAVVPCVTLHDLQQLGSAQPVMQPAAGVSAGSPIPGAADGAASSAGGAQAYALPIPLDSLDRPLAIAVPTAQSVDRALPVQVLTIPAGIKPGTVLHLVALIPADVPQSGDRPAIEAVLTVEVS